MKKIKGLYQRPNSPFYWMRLADPHGGMIRESTGCTDFKEAQRVLKAKRDFVAAARIGRATIISADEKAKTVHDLLMTFLADCEVRQVSSLPTIRFYVNAVDTKLGMLRAATVSDETITQYKAEQVKAHVAASTINHRLQVLKQALRPFYIKTLRQPMPEIKKLPEHNVRETFFSDAQAEALIAHLPADLQDFALWGWQTGWRKGEIASLKWANVDRAAGEIRLSWTKSKTKKARVIGLDRELAAIIERRWQARPITAPDGTIRTSPLVFHRGVKKNGQIIPVGDFDKVFKTACETIGIPYGRLTGGFTFHCFRRTAARNMVRSGTSETVAMRITGHATNSMFRRYNITNVEDTRQAMQRVQAVRITRRATQQPEASNVIPLKEAHA
jgi:integrase